MMHSSLSLDAQASDTAGAEQSVAWQQYPMVHVIWRVPGNAPQAAQGRSPPGNPLCLVLLDNHDTMVVVQVNT